MKYNDINAKSTATVKSRRLKSLDVARGMTIALMIFVDNVGDSWPHVDHTPWNGLRLADFVMPSFDVIVGIAVVLSMKHGRLNADAKRTMFVAALKRSAKLFLLGVWTQAGTDFPTVCWFYNFC
jgi:predicted acyltransferase